MTVGWFDAFRENGAPTWYGENRSPVFVDFQIVLILLIFAVPIVAYLLICCGIRRNKWITTYSFLFFALNGAVLLVAICSSSWHAGNVRISTAYKAHTNARLNATLGVKIGLKHLNITLSTKHSDHYSFMDLVYEDKDNGLNYNERFDFADVTSMEAELKNALEKGLPYPILKVIEYLSVDRAGFTWGRKYRLAGYYTDVILWLAFSVWNLQLFLLILVPHYFAKTGFLVGIITLLANLIYFINTPSNLHIRFEAPSGHLTVLTFCPSWAFWLTFAAGWACLINYGILWILQAKTTFRFKTIFTTTVDKINGLPRPISMPQGCPSLETPIESNLSSLNRSVSAYRNSLTPSTISCSLEFENERS
uniref:Uncharacterized protein n=1 Tax=Panagrolaimus sp. JU765 TaxID=591449 RepID=A0AC34RHK6_9BILA